MKALLWFLCLSFGLVLARAQNGIPGTQTTTAPLAPPATNSPFGATDNRYQLGGFGTWGTNLSQLNDLNWLPMGRRQAGMRQSLQGNPIPYVLRPNLTSWAPTDVPRILPEFFGAKGDGVTDDSAAIQATIDYIESLPNGGEMVFGPNTYLCKNIHTTKDNKKLVRVTGMNRAGIKYNIQAKTLLKLPTGANTNLWRVTLGSATDFQGICFDGNYFGNTAAMPLVVIEHNDSITNQMGAEMHFTSCVFTDSRGDGVYINRNEVGFTDCYAIRNQGNGFFFDGKPDADQTVFGGALDCTFITCNAGFNQGSGFYFYNAGGSTGRFFNCDSYINGKDGLTFDAGPSPGSYLVSMRFVCCTINNNVGNGISLSTANSAYPTNSAAGLVNQVIFDSCWINGSNNDGKQIGLPNPPAGAASEIVIYDGPYNYGYNFQNCIIGYTTGGTLSVTNKPQYLIDDRRTGATYGTGRGVTLIGCIVGQNAQYNSGLRWRTSFEDNSTRFGTIDGDNTLIGGGYFANKTITVGGTINLNNGTGLTQFYQPYAAGGLAIQYGSTGQPARYAVFDGTNGNLSLPNSLTLGGVAVITNGINASGNIRTSGNSIVGGDSVITGNSTITGAATIAGGAIISGGATVHGLTLIDSTLALSNGSGFAEFYLPYPNGGLAFQFNSAGLPLRYAVFDGTNGNFALPTSLTLGGLSVLTNGINVPGDLKMGGNAIIGPTQTKVSGGGTTPVSADPNGSIYMNSGGATRNTVLVRDPAAGTPEWRPVNSDVASYLELAQTTSPTLTTTGEYTLEFGTPNGGPIGGTGAPGMTTSGNGIITSQGGTIEVTAQIRLFNFTAGNTSTFWIVTNGVPVPFSAIRWASAPATTENVLVLRRTMTKTGAGTQIEVHGQVSMANGARITTTAAGVGSAPLAPANPGAILTAKLIN